MSDLDALLAEQIAYYRALAPEYSETAIPDFPAGELREAHDAALTALDELDPGGDVLELACGPGTWTSELVQYADRVTAIDASPEMLELAAAKVRDRRVRFVQADLFGWRPDRRYDVVFFGFWLSHVPLERFSEFWQLVDRCLHPCGGRVAFVDDAYRTPGELINGEQSSIIERRLTDGSSFRAVKVPHIAEELQERLHRLGWNISVRYLRGPFFWGSGTRRLDELHSEFTMDPVVVSRSSTQPATQERVVRCRSRGRL